MRFASGSRDDHLASRSARGRPPAGHFPAPARTPIGPRSRRGVRRPLQMRGADLIGLTRVEHRRARRRLDPQPHQRAAARRASRALGGDPPQLGPGRPEHVRHARPDRDQPPQQLQRHRRRRAQQPVMPHLRTGIGPELGTGIGVSSFFRAGIGVTPELVSVHFSRRNWCQFIFQGPELVSVHFSGRRLRPAAGQVWSGPSTTRPGGTGTGIGVAGIGVSSFFRDRNWCQFIFQAVACVPPPVRSGPDRARPGRAGRGVPADGGRAGGAAEVFGGLARQCRDGLDRA